MPGLSSGEVLGAAGAAAGRPELRIPGESMRRYAEVSDNSPENESPSWRRSRSPTWKAMRATYPASDPAAVLIGVVFRGNDACEADLRTAWSRLNAGDSTETRESIGEGITPSPSSNQNSESREANRSPIHLAGAVSKPAAAWRCGGRFAAYGAEWGREGASHPSLKPSPSQGSPFLDTATLPVREVWPRRHNEHRSHHLTTAACRIMRDHAPRPVCTSWQQHSLPLPDLDPDNHRLTHPRQWWIVL